MRGALGIVLAAVVLMACLSSPKPVPRSFGPGEVAVPVANWNNGQVICAGAAFPGTLHGSPTDVRVVWMTRPAEGPVELAWPAGYSARFDPDLELLDASGRVVGREGTSVTGGCPTADPGVMAVELAAVSP